MDTCGDARWGQQHAPDLLARRGYSPAAVEAARRFYNGQLTPAEWMSTALKFIDAYYDHRGFLGRIHEMVKESGVKMQPEAHIFGFSQLLTGWTVMDRLGEIKQPTLVLAGRHDFLFPPECQAILADRLPNAQLELIERAGHNAPSERPAEVIAAIRRFLGAAAMSTEKSYLPMYMEAS
jgi:proline iminopeptidase